MPRAALPANESERLSALEECGVLDTLPEPGFDDLTALAAELCEVPIALVSLVDYERQWFKSAVGLCETQTSRDWAFCAHALLMDRPLVINDATLDARTADNPLVVGALNIRFYAGVQLRTVDGHVLGTLCVIDTKPRQITPRQLEALTKLARQAVTQLELRRSNRQTLQAKEQASRVAVALQQEVARAEEAGRQLQQATEVLHRAGAMAKVGGWEYDVAERKLTWSTELYVMHGVDPGTPIDIDRAIEFYAPHTRRVVTEAIEDAVASGRAWDVEQPITRSDGREVWVRSRGEAVTRDGKAVLLRGVAQDVTDRRLAEEQLRVNATHDKLTSLPNRLLLNDRLQHCVHRMSRARGRGFAVLFLDLDRFKLVNDSLGHQAGDQLLKEVAMRLRSTLRAGDTVARGTDVSTPGRLGGDEFVVILEDLKSPHDAVMLAERLLSVFGEPYQLGEHEFTTTASIGIVIADGTPTSAEAVMRDADTALYEAKAAGRGRYVLFDVEMRQRVQTRIDIEQDLRRAVQDGTLHVAYQPIVSLKTGAMVGVEALARWNHPTRGNVTPAEFIPIAEETGLIVPLGEWILRAAVKQFMQWQTELGEAAPPGLSVNLSRKQLALPHLPALIREILDHAGMSPDRLSLEVTESTVMETPEVAEKLMHAIRDIGVRLHLDDFGTGYSSLACLHQFPIQALKIDRSFVANMDRGRAFGAVIQAVAQLARMLDLQVVAEGIETVEQVNVLRSLGCDFAQGYYISRPLSAAQMADFVTKQNRIEEATCDASRKVRAA